MFNNLLYLITGEPEILSIGAQWNTAYVKQALGMLAHIINPVSRNLGVMFESNFGPHVNTSVRSGFYQLRNIAKVTGALCLKITEQTIHAFITSCLDYCKDWFATLKSSSIAHLQAVQTATTRRLTRSLLLLCFQAQNIVHKSLPVASISWLPAQYRINVKNLLITLEAFRGFSEYVFELVIPYQTPRPLQSSAHGFLDVPKSRLMTKGDKAFPAMAPTLWRLTPKQYMSWLCSHC